MKWDKVITTEQEYKLALKRLSDVFDAHADSPEAMEAELLVILPEKYNREHFPIALPDPVNAIREAM